MKVRVQAFLWVALLALPAVAGPDADDLRYSRWTGEPIGIRVDADLLAADAWDLGRPVANPATAEELRKDPGPAGRLLSRQRIRTGRLTVPAGEFDATLWREELAGSGGTAWQYRWIAHGGPTLALLRGPATGGATFDDPAMLVRLESAEMLPGLRIYDDEIAIGIFPTDCSLGAGACLVGDGMNFAFDAAPAVSPGVEIPLSDLTTQGYSPGSTFTNPPTAVWDFTPVSGLGPGTVFETDVAIAAGETCNSLECGYTLPGNDFISRQDLLATAVCVGGANDTLPCTPLDANSCPGGFCSASQTNAVFDETFFCIGGTNALSVCDPMAPDPCGGGSCVPAVLLVAGTQREGTNDENRFCYDGMPDADQGANRGLVAQWLFPNPDGARHYMQVGDLWQSTVFNCTRNLFNFNCGVSIPLVPGNLKTNPKLDESRPGRFETEVLNEGSIKLPSGHWADALVLQQVASFVVYGGSSSCSLTFTILQRVRQPVVLFLVPNMGVMVQVNGPLNAADTTNWTGVNETVIRYGLLPPLDITTGTVTDTTVQLSWDPGTQFGAIERVKIYWDTDSGASTGYAFNSDDNSGQVVFDPDGPEGFPLGAQVNGLTPGTDYFFTITFLRNYTEPDSTPYTVEYESLLYPATFSGTEGGVGGTQVSYPIEVPVTTAVPGCTPTTEVTGLVLSPGPGGQCQFDWNPVADPCIDRYVILGANDPSGFGNFSVVTTTGLSTTFTGNPAEIFYLVVAEGAGGQRGPVGHYGQ